MKKEKTSKEVASHMLNVTGQLALSRMQANWDGFLSPEILETFAQNVQISAELLADMMAKSAAGVDNGPLISALVILRGDTRRRTLTEALLTLYKEHNDNTRELLLHEVTKDVDAARSLAADYEKYLQDPISVRSLYPVLLPMLRFAIAGAKNKEMKS